MAVPFSNTKLRIPQGFQNLLEGLAREVLRDQPKDVCAFAAAYFESQLNYRNKTGYDPVERGARLEDRAYNNKSFEQPGVQPGNVEQEGAALKIQTKYRQFTAKKDVQEMREDQAAVKIQAGYRGYRDRRRVKALKNDRYRAQSNTTPAQEKEDEDNYVDPEKVIAATKIQSGFRGYKARKETRVRKEAAFKQSLEDEARQAPAVDRSQEEEEVEERSSIDLSDPEVMDAALKIQAGLTGFKFRQEFADAPASGEGENLGTSTDEALQEAEQPDEQSVPDADMHKAATKIQAGFRGMQDRRRVKAIKATQSTTITEQRDNEVSQSQEDAEEKTGNEPIDVAATDAEQETGKEEAAVTETPRDAPEVEEAGELPDDVDAGASVDASVDADVKPAENESEAEGVKDSERTEIDFSEQPSATEVGREVVVETPRNLPEETPRDLPEETPRDLPEETPRDRPEETPRDHLEETPRDLLEKTPRDLPEETTRDHPEETPRDHPEETPRDHPEETPRDHPEETPRDLPEETPRDHPEKTPRDHPEETPREPENETLRDSVTETPRGEREETPGEPADETPRNFPNETLSDLAEESSQDPTVDETPRQLSDETSKDDDSEEK